MRNTSPPDLCITVFTCLKRKSCLRVKTGSNRVTKASAPSEGFTIIAKNVFATLADSVSAAKPIILSY